ncbi:MAG: hypothetical protein MH137_10670 [Flavobacteriales bacterium]|nr:hypothetical protein [Flavobacteriales bacterium]
MKKRIGFIALTFLLKVNALHAQNIPAQELDRFNQERNRITRGGMFALGGWALGNFAVSGVGWARGEGSNKYFHMGNVLWNTVNLGLAIPGIVRSYRDKTDGFSYVKTLKYQNRAEKIYLFNAGLDVGYIMAGFALKGYAHKIVNRKDMMQGFGNSLLMQGGFLLLYDTGMFLAHHIHFRQRIRKPYPEMAFTGNGLYLKYSF